jgi:hypothetical protein
MACAVALMTVLSGICWLITRCMKWCPVAGLVLFLISPAWTIGGIIGDCGYLMAGAASIVACLYAICFTIHFIGTAVVLAGRVARKRQRAVAEDYRARENDSENA